MVVILFLMCFLFYSPDACLAEQPRLRNDFMKTIILAAAISLLPVTAFAGGHLKVWNMAGLANAPSSSKMMEGTT